MNIVLLYPPEMDPFAPMLALPTLTAFLRENGCRVVQKDVNVELIDHFCNKEPLEEIWDICNKRFHDLDSKRFLDWKEQNEYAKYLSDTFIKLPYYIENIQSIKDRIKDIRNYTFDSDGEPLLAKEWAVIDEIKSIVFQPVRRYIPLKIRELSTKVLLHTIENRDQLFYSKYYEEVTIPAIKKENPSLVGISITFPDQVMPSLLLAHMVKKAMPEVHLCIGGSHFSLLQQELLDLRELFTFIDSFIIGEGEYSLLELARCIDEGKDLNEVPGMIFKNKKNVVSTPLQPIRDINTFPCPDFTGLPLEKYFIGKLTLPYAFSRGCHYAKCTFCNFHHASFRYRVRKPELVIEDLRQLNQQYNTRLFYFTHEADPPTRMKQIYSLMKENQFDFKYFTFCRFEKKFDEELAKLLAETGCIKLYFGLESGNVNTLIINKGISLDTARNILEICTKAKLPTTLSSIQCFPTETPEERMDTLRFYDEILAEHELCTGGSHIFRLAKGSPIEKNYQQFGIEKIFYESSGNLHTVFNFKQKNDNFTPSAKKAARANLAKVIKEYSRFSDYSYLQFAENGFDDFVKWTRYVKQVEISLSQPKNGKNGNGFHTSNLDNYNFSLAESVEIKKLNFPLHLIKKAVNERTNIIYNLFFNEGHPMDDIESRYLTGEDSVENSTHIVLCDSASGEHALFHEGGKPLLDLLREGHTIVDIIKELRNTTSTKETAIRTSVEKTLVLFKKKGFLVFEKPLPQYISVNQGK